eukprot:577858-Amorphochlora_amoeboformis.AAC.2
MSTRLGFSPLSLLMTVAIGALVALVLIRTTGEASSVHGRHILSSPITSSSNKVKSSEFDKWMCPGIDFRYVPACKMPYG